MLHCAVLPPGCSCRTPLHDRLNLPVSQYPDGLTDVALPRPRGSLNLVGKNEIHMGNELVQLPSHCRREALAGPTSVQKRGVTMRLRSLQEIDRSSSPQGWHDEVPAEKKVAWRCLRKDLLDLSDIEVGEVAEMREESALPARMGNTNRIRSAFGNPGEVPGYLSQLLNKQVTEEVLPDVSVQVERSAEALEGKRCNAGSATKSHLILGKEDLGSHLRPLRERAEDHIQVDVAEDVNGPTLHA